MTKFLILLLVFAAWAQDGRFPEVTPADYEKQAQEERIENEKTGIEIRQNMRESSGLKENSPLLRRKNEPYNQADKIMRPD